MEISVATGIPLQSLVNLDWYEIDTYVDVLRRQAK